MCLNIFANININNDDNNIFKKKEFIETLNINDLKINMKDCNIKCWISVLEYCIDEKINGKWQRIIPKNTIKKWSLISNQILEKTNKEFKMVVSQNESADYNDVKQMTLYLDICHKFNAELEFI